MIRSAVLTQITGVTSNSDSPDSDGPDFDGPGFDGSPAAIGYNKPEPSFRDFRGLLGAFGVLWWSFGNYWVSFVVFRAITRTVFSSTRLLLQQAELHSNLVYRSFRNVIKCTITLK